jgi:hypothetical protein
LLGHEADNSSVLDQFGGQLLLQILYPTLGRLGALVGFFGSMFSLSSSVLGAIGTLALLVGPFMGGGQLRLQ